MVRLSKDQRSEQRTCFEPTDTGYRLESTIAGRAYTFNVLNVCRGGIGMLVREDQHEVLPLLVPGAEMRMDYINPKGRLTLTVLIRHITRIDSGEYKGLHTVGFSMSV
ncbi:MAG: hypothetical protein V1793_11815 [Pseudomonadota bacterium]